jgi:hypothetical protein
MFGVALKLMMGPIGWIIAAIATLIAYFKRTEEGQNALTKITKIFQVVLQNLLDIVGKIGEALFNAITKPKESWEKFKDFVKGVGEFFQNTFGNIIGGSIQVFVGTLEKGFANVGLAWQKLKDIFIDNSEKIKTAQDKVKEKQDEVDAAQARVAKGAENLGDAVKSAYDKARNAIQKFIEENEREIAIAKRLADQQAALDKRIRAEIVNDAKDEMKIAKLREEAAKKDIYNGEERLKLLNEAIELEKKMLAEDLDIARQKASIHAQEIAMSDSTKEDLNEQAQLEAEIFKLQAANAEKLRSFEKQRQTAIKDMLDDQRTLAEAQVKQLEYELEQYRVINRNKLDINKEGLKAEIEILRQSLDIKLTEIESQENISNEIKEQLRLQAENETNLKVSQLNADWEDMERERKLEAAQTDYENQLILAEESIFQRLEIERAGLDLKYQQEIEAAERIGADTTLIDAKYKDAKIELARAERDAKLAIAQDYLGKIAAIAGEGTKIGKMAASAVVTIEGIKGAMSAFSGMVQTIPGPVGIGLGIAAAAAVIATSIANIKKIWAVKSGLKGDTGGGGGAAAGGGGTAAQTKLATTAPEVGKGIISRETVTKTTAPGRQINQPVLVVDNVTSKQMAETQKTETSTL